MTQSDGSAVDVDLLQGHLEVRRGLLDDGCERFVDLEEVQVTGGDALSAQRGGDGAGGLRVQGGVRARDLSGRAHRGEDAPAFPLGAVTRGEDEGGGAVGQRRGGARGDGAVCEEGRAEASERLGGGVGADALVVGEFQRIARALGDAEEMISSAKRPDCAARAARWCDWAAIASWSSRLKPSAALTRSVEAPMDSPVAASVRPSRDRESTAETSP